MLKGVDDLTVFAEIQRAIMADPMNQEYTERGIPPLFKASEEARLVIVGRLQDAKEETRLFWNDPSGDRLREWLDVTREEFYGSEKIAQLRWTFTIRAKPNLVTSRLAKALQKNGIPHCLRRCQM